MGIDGVALRPVTEPDLPVMERFLIDPQTVVPFQWWGWSDTGHRRRQRAENGLLGDDGGYLMVVRGAERLGFVAWRQVRPTRTSGESVGTEAQRQLVHYLFAHTTVVRIEADTEAWKKVGFTREGVLRGEPA